uniref:Uncharacterized protein n=1 Tax=Arundo donax TaxID=35708 RepID=A0A0A9B7K4_ARUDO
MILQLHNMRWFVVTIYVGYCVHCKVDNYICSIKIS